MLLGSNVDRRLIAVLSVRTQLASWAALCCMFAWIVFGVEAFALPYAASQLTHIADVEWTVGMIGCM